MLTQQQQLLLIKIKEKPQAAETNGVYNSDAFYKSVSHLIKNDLVYVDKQNSDRRKSLYHLTLKGFLLAEILASISR